MGREKNFSVTIEDVKDYLQKVYPTLEWSGNIENDDTYFHPYHCTHTNYEGYGIDSGVMWLGGIVDFNMYNKEKRQFQIVRLRFELAGIAGLYPKTNGTLEFDEELSQIWRGILLENHGIAYVNCLLNYSEKRICEEKNNFNDAQKNTLRRIGECIKLLEKREQEKDLKCNEYEKMKNIAKSMIAKETQGSNNKR